MDLDLSKLFIDVAALPEGPYGLFQLLSIGFVYGYVLMIASNLISDGSELLLLIPALAGLVGSVVLPILGAVPDGCIVLFSGMGPNAQEELNVGIGALAGSTIMLLTVPLFLSILGGRVDINKKTGRLSYGQKVKLADTSLNLLDSTTGVAASSPIINKTAIFMLLTAVSYLVIQVPGLYYIDMSTTVIAEHERRYAFYGFIFCFSFFVFYLWYQYIHKDDGHVEAQLEQSFVAAIQDGEISLLGVMCSELSSEGKAEGTYQKVGEATPLSAINDKSMGRLRRLLKPFFKKYDADGNGSLDIMELTVVFKDLGEKLSQRDLMTLFAAFDKAGKGSIGYDDFVLGVADYILSHNTLDNATTSMKVQSKRINDSLRSVEEGDGEVEEEEDVPEDLKSLSPDEQQRRVLMRSCYMMLLGTGLVILFSDPMVAVFSEIGKRTSISPFYISFVLAPLASNASEVIASYNYSLKKTSKSMEISISALLGAAIMNNTFCLAIFMLLIYVQGLSWEFAAEVLAIVLVELVVALVCFKTALSPRDGTLLLCLYPASLLLVSTLNSAGWAR